MATTTVLSRPAVVINSVDYSDQCTSATLTITEEALEATTFADSARKFTAGLTNVEFTCTLMLAYDTAEVEANLEGLVGTTTTVEVYATNSTSPGVTNPEYTITGAFLAGFTPVVGTVGELSMVTVNFVGGTWARDIT